MKTQHDVTFADGAFAIEAALSPSQITADQNDYNPSGLSKAVVLRLSTDASRTITGLAGGANGRIIVVVNVGSNNLVLADDSASSSAANRFALSGAITLAADDACTLRYDSTSSRWRCIGKSPGTTGAVSGPGSATDNAVARFDGTGGATIQNSGVTIDDSNNMSGVAALAATTIELGHASDTTLSRSAAGVVSVEGVQLVQGPASSTDNRIVTFNGTGGYAVDNGANWTCAGANLTCESSGGIIQAHSSGALTMQAYDTGNSAYRTFVRFTSFTSPSLKLQGYNTGAANLTDFITITSTTTATCDLNTAVTIGTAYIYRAGGTDIPVTDGGTGGSDAATARTNLGVGTGDSPQFAAINLGDASDTTITRVSAGLIAVEGATLATRTYVDDAVEGRKWKNSVRAATTANITLSGEQTIDGVAVVAGDRVLVKDQSTGADNGIYVASASAWARSSDASTAAEVLGMAMLVEEGTVAADKQYVCTTNGPITLGSTSLAFTQYGSGGGAVSDGDKGDITVSSSGTVWTIDNDVVTYAKMQNVSATDKILGRSSSGSGDVEEIACTAAGRAILDDADAAAQRTTLGITTVATDAIFAAKGDLAVGTGANTAAKLTVGANGTIPQADSAESTGIKWIARSFTPQGQVTLSSGNPTYAPQALTPSSTDTGTPESVTFASAHGWTVGTMIVPASTVGGLTVNVIYYVSVNSSTSVSFHTTLTDAVAGTNKVNLTANITQELRPVGVANTSIYYEPFRGNQLPINGVPTTFAALTLALDSDSGHTGYQQSGKVFDLFVINDSGTIRLASGPAWTSDTARADDVVLTNGIWVNSGTITLRFGSASGNTVSVAAGAATLVGTFRAVANGQVHIRWTGIDATCDLYFASIYHPVEYHVSNHDTTDSWTYGNETVRQRRASANNQINVLNPLPGHCYVDLLNCIMSNNTSGNRRDGIGYDSTTAHYWSGFAGYAINATASEHKAKLAHRPALGVHYYASLESSQTTGTCLWYGDNGNNLLYRYGLGGTVKL